MMYAAFCVLTFFFFSHVTFLSGNKIIYNNKNFVEKEWRVVLLGMCHGIMIQDDTV